MVRNATHRFFSVSCLWACALILGCCLGCARHDPASLAASPVPAPGTSKPADNAVEDVGSAASVPYKRGLQAFETGHLKKAAAIWRECLVGETDAAARQRTLFALAAVKLLLAANESDLTMAMDLLDSWAGNNPPGGSGEDPRFFLALARAFKPSFAFKEQRAAGDKECAKKLAEREKQVRHMQQQVKALETIHREIQEKKKGLTSY
jgi:hypothetical protein